MAILKIYEYPHPVLKKKAEPVAEVNDDLRKVLDDMLETMYEAPGVGLAAPQVGLSQRMVVIDAARDDEAGYCVEDELKLVENYAVIQKARFMNFELVIEKDENCLTCRIRKFVLQPIIENAVIHGLGRGKIKNTEIKVKVWADENLHIIVEDQGVGFDVEEWRQKPGKKEGHTNIGIHNVEEMIRMEYGENYGMWIESSPGAGTKVTYLLPVIRGIQK